METTSEIETFGAKSDGENGGNLFQFSWHLCRCNVDMVKSCSGLYIYTCVVDLNSRVKGLLERIEKLENEKQQIREEFGHQRAKMKELYLQKEGNYILRSETI